MTDRFPFGFESKHIGKQVIHVSHDLRLFRGLIFCNTCGCRAQHKLHGLAHQCSPPTPYGAASLRKLNKGKLPPKLSCWPDVAMSIDNPIPSEMLCGNVVLEAEDNLQVFHAQYDNSLPTAPSPQPLIPPDSSAFVHDGMRCNVHDVPNCGQCRYFMGGMGPYYRAYCEGPDCLGCPACDPNAVSDSD